MKRTIGNIIFIIYAIIAVFVTICLLSFNEYKVSEFGDTSLVIVDNEELEPTYNKGDLVIVDKSKRIREGDTIFFYNSSADVVEVTLATVQNVEKVNDSEYTYAIDGDRSISSEYVLGNAKDVTKISTIGTVLGVLESKWGFLILIVFPSLFAFIYEITVVFTEIREGKKAEAEEDDDNETDKSEKDDDEEDIDDNKNKKTETENEEVIEEPVKKESNKNTEKKKTSTKKETSNKTNSSTTKSTSKKSSVKKDTERKTETPTTQKKTTRKTTKKTKPEDKSNE